MQPACGTRGCSQPNLTCVSISPLGPPVSLHGAFMELGLHSYTFVITTRRTYITRWHRYETRSQEGMKDSWSRASPPTSASSSGCSTNAHHSTDSWGRRECLFLRVYGCALCSITKTIVDNTQHKCQKIGNLINCNRSNGVLKSLLLMVMIYIHTDMGNIQNRLRKKQVTNMYVLHESFLICYMCYMYNVCVCLHV